ncbi:hypothetical protein DL762_009153 [Monosporascus cannonballus]|uniref:Uncharacterized protein n=1 Tax=Monosporascus cannonballus TaxID=155416 RepID=A0ABY0GUG2_9PEZI|nr:hypothetical protein DL762_009153 [Monosporascus cannonballus]
MYKLMSRAFLNHFANNSVRAHFPFVVPEENEAILDTLGISEKCLYQPERVGRRDEFILTTKNLLEKAAAWALPPSPGAPEEKFFEADTVWNVIVPLKTRFVAEFFGLPVKAAETAHRGVYTERELYLLLIAMFTTVFFDNDPPTRSSCGWWRASTRLASSGSRSKPT